MIRHDIARVYLTALHKALGHDIEPALALGQGDALEAVAAAAAAEARALALRQAMDLASKVSNDQNLMHKCDGMYAANQIRRGLDTLLRAADPSTRRASRKARPRCGLCLDYRWLDENGDPASGRRLSQIVHSCPKCNPSGKLNSKLSVGAAAFKARPRKERRYSK